MANKKNLKILFIGDISTRSGRQIIKEALPEIRSQHKIDFVIANCENAAGGRGITREILNELQSYGIDFFTTGEHVWDIPRFRNDLKDENLPLLRPYNYESQEKLPGKGWDVIDLGQSGRLVLVNFIGQVFMKNDARSPFWTFDNLYGEIEKSIGSENLKEVPMIIDMHAEATAEKIAFAWYVRNRAAAVVGTHTHVGTVDTRLLRREDNENYCAFVSDIGMCGPRDASLWVNFDSVIHNFKFPYKKSFKVEKSGGRIFNSVLIEIEKNSAKNITRIDKNVD